MEIVLENIGILRNVKVEINNIAVIAGENDTGKSTVGKALMCLMKTELISRAKYQKKLKELKSEGKEINKENLKKYFFKNRKYGFNRLSELLFKDGLRTDIDLYDIDEKKYLIELFFEDKTKKLKVYFDKEKNEWRFSEDSLKLEDEFYYKDITYIQSPLIWDLQSFFNSILQMKFQIEIEEDIKFDFEYPYLLWDLYGKLVRKKIKNISKFHLNVIKTIKADIIKGEFVQKNNIFLFRRKNVDIPLINVAHGIKSFGILQVLLENGYISKYGILVIDEPEVHLHPLWQVEYAKILIYLAKNNIKILLNTHSPYIIEALKRYSEEENIENKVKFYLAEDRIIKSQENLEEIFRKLGEPLRKLKQLKMKRYLNNKG